MRNNYEKIYSDLVKNNLNSKIILDWRTRNEDLIKFLRDIPNRKDKRILELGSGRGFMTKYLKENGFNIVGSDFNKYNLKLAKEINKINLKHIDATKIKEKDNNFDVIIAIELIEHLPKIDTNIKEVRRILKKNGMYCITTPNKYVEETYNLLTGKKPDKYHISLQTHKSLKKALKNNGFEVQFIRMKSFPKSQKEKIGAFHKFIPLQFLPRVLQPSIICIARKNK